MKMRLTFKGPDVLCDAVNDFERCSFLQRKFFEIKLLKNNRELKSTPPPGVLWNKNEASGFYGIRMRLVMNIISLTH